MFENVTKKTKCARAPRAKTNEDIPAYFFFKERELSCDFLWHYYQLLWMILKNVFKVKDVSLRLGKKRACARKSRGQIVKSIKTT